MKSQRITMMVLCCFPGYLIRNGLIKRYRKLSIDINAHKYQVWDRMLEMDEWQAVQRALIELPEETQSQQDIKARTHNTA